MPSDYGIFSEIPAPGSDSPPVTLIPDAATVYPPPVAGVTSSDVTGIFSGLAGTVGSIASSASSLIQSITNTKLATLDQQNALAIRQAQGQVALARVQAALNPSNNSGLVLVLAIVGIGLAWMQYAHK